MFIFREDASTQPQLSVFCKEIKVLLSEVMEWSLLLLFAASNFSLCIQQAKPVAVQKGRTWGNGWLVGRGQHILLSVFGVCKALTFLRTENSRVVMWKIA